LNVKGYSQVQTKLTPSEKDDIRSYICIPLHAAQGFAHGDDRM
jgi:hypothetical protein